MSRLLAAFGLLNVSGQSATQVEEAAVICIETRQVKAALKAMRNKTDRNDARGLAQIMRTGWFRMVHVKGSESHELRSLLTNHKTLQRKAPDIENEIRGTLKAFGLKVGKVSRRRFEARVLELAADRAALRFMVTRSAPVRSTIPAASASAAMRWTGPPCTKPPTRCSLGVRGGRR